jgi:hypothetical protein
LEVAGWWLKQHVMPVTPESVPEERLLSATAAMAAAAVPAATATHGLGFLLAHQTRPACFVLLDWWQDGYDLKQRYQAYLPDVFSPGHGHGSTPEATAGGVTSPT